MAQPRYQPRKLRPRMAERQIAKYDKNKDGQLSADEWRSMIVKPKEGTDVMAMALSRSKNS